MPSPGEEDAGGDAGAVVTDAGPLPPTCTDRIKNGDETDVDCGGGLCVRCDDAQGCTRGADCFSGSCDAGSCAPSPTCRDGLRNGAETDVDCGGAQCPVCQIGQRCVVGIDCVTLLCDAGVCRQRPIMQPCQMSSDCGPGFECTDRVIESDGTWRQTMTAAAGWEQPAFNDSSWLPAFVQEPHGSPGTWGSAPAMPIGTRANWIWYRDSRFIGDSSTVYFRKTFVGPPTPTTLFISVDDAFTAYLNGVPVASATSWYNTIIVPMTTTSGGSYVLAVRAVNVTGPGGVVADLRSGSNWCRPIDDGGVADAGTVDAGTPDAGVPDAGVPDAGVPDAGTGPCTCIAAPFTLPQTSVLMNDPQPIGMLPAGTYCWWWEQGAFQYANNPCWVVSALNPGYRLIDENGAMVSAMTGGAGCPSTQAAAEAAFPAQPFTFNWSGGSPRIYLYDSDYSGNAPGAPSPVLKMCQAP